MRGPEPDAHETLDQVLSMVVHKFGNSLNSHNITLEVLLRNFEQFEEPKKIHFLERALEQTRKQQHLLSALKSYSGLCVGEVRPVRFESFWSRFLESIAPRFKGGSIRFEAWQELGSRSVVMDGRGLTQALVLLVDNAVDAVEEVDSPHVVLSAAGDDEDRSMALLNLSDNGSGIVERFMGSIFTPLFTTRQDRFGLGLPLARKIINGMGGSLCVVRNETEGVTAQLRLRMGDTP